MHLPGWIELVVESFEVQPYVHPINTNFRTNRADMRKYKIWKVSSGGA